MGVGGQRHASAALPLEIKRYTLVLRAGLDGCWNFRPPPLFDSRTVYSNRVAIPIEPSQSTIVVILTVISTKLQAQNAHKTSHKANTIIAET
jgi:hypothetical protein